MDKKEISEQLKPEEGQGATNYMVELGMVFIIILMGIWLFVNNRHERTGRQHAHYMSLPDELYAAQKGERLYIHTVNDTDYYEFYDPNQYLYQSDPLQVRILCDSIDLLFPCEIQKEINHESEKQH